MKYQSAFFLLIISGKSLSFEAYPSDFADFFIEREESVELLVAGESQGKFIKAMVTHDAFTLINNDENKAKLRAYLQEQNLTPIAIANIENTLLKGITEVPSCEGSLTLCVPVDIPEQAEYIFDFDAKQLKTFVSSDMMQAKSTKAEYHEHFRAQSALINNANLYTYINKGESADFTWNNDATIGLPLGHISLDTQYRSENNEFDLYSALYDLEIKNVRALIGYQEFNRTNFNSTDFLSYGANLSGTAITLGSSQNLLKGGTQAQQRFYFFAPEAGQLEIYQGERLLINRTIKSGQQFISYDELPTGVYNITILIRRGDQEVLREQRQVVNNSRFNLPVDSFDYRFEAGYLDDNNIEQTDFDNKERYYWRSAASYRAAETLLFASSFMGNKDSLGWQFGAQWSPHSNLYLQYTNTLFDKEASYHYAQINLSSFSASVRKVDIMNTNNSFASLLYDEENSLEWSLSLSGSLFGGTGFISYYNNKFDNINSTDRDYQGFSTSWSRELLGGNLGISFLYNHYEDGDHDWSSSLTWSKSFGENFSMRFAGFTDDEHENLAQTSATLSTKGENWRASGTAGLRISDNTVSDISGYLNGNSNYVKYSAFGFANDQGSRSFSGSLSSTQVISESGIKATHKSGKAFVTINPKLATETNRDVKVNYQFVRNNKPWQKGSLLANNAHTSSVIPYNEISVAIDAENSNAEVDYDTSKKFIMPGMHYQIDTLVTPLESQIVIISDIDGELVDLVQCTGNGCESIEMLSEDGVYRVNYKQGQTFSLAAQGMTCFYDEKTLGQEYITSSCLTEGQMLAKNNNQPNGTNLNNFAAALDEASQQENIQVNILEPVSNSLISNEDLTKIMKRIEEIRNSSRVTE